MPYAKSYPIPYHAMPNHTPYLKQLVTGAAYIAQPDQVIVRLRLPRREYVQRAVCCYRFCSRAWGRCRSTRKLISINKKV